jgi:hypothetical protein
MTARESLGKFWSEYGLGKERGRWRRDSPFYMSEEVALNEKI